MRGWKGKWAATLQDSEGREPGHDSGSCEREMLALTVEGSSNPRNGDWLVTSVHDVGSCVDSTFPKPGVPNQAEAVALAPRNKLDT